LFFNESTAKGNEGLDASLGRDEGQR
jgi:hypothetical protein